MSVAGETVAYEAAARVERALGCPFDPSSTMSFAASVRSDEAETPPDASFDAIRELGVWDCLVPVELGGQLRSFEELLAVVRTLARRDLVVPVGFGSTLLAALPVWLWGSEDQRATVARHVLGGEFGALGISEDAAGSDLLTTATRATRTPAGYVLDGEKWLIGNAARSAFMVVLAAGEGGLGLFLVDVGEAGPGSLRALPKISTMGLRGHDLGGMSFEACALGPDAAVGTVGRGLEMTLGTLQFTRTLVGGLALGATDTTLRVALRWARDRRLYGAPIVELPPIRQLLAGAFADLLACECVATAAARGLNLALPRMALWSASAKYTVPRLCEQAMRDCAEVLSARHYLRERVADGIVQKMLRDLAIASIFEGTQLVQLATIHAQLVNGARVRGVRSQPVVDRLELFDFGAPLEPWDPARKPRLSHGGHDEICHDLDGAVEELLGAAPPERAALEAQTRRLLAVRDRLREDTARCSRERSLEGYELARRYCLLNAAACCVHAGAERAWQADSAWLVVALERMLERLGEPCVRQLSELEDRCLDRLVELDEENRLFSILPSPLASGGGV